MEFVELYFIGFTLGLFPALAFLLLCGAYTAVCDSAREIVSAA